MNKLILFFKKCKDFLRQFFSSVRWIYFILIVSLLDFSLILDINKRPLYDIVTDIILVDLIILFCVFLAYVGRAHVQPTSNNPDNIYVPNDYTISEIQLEELIDKLNNKIINHISDEEIANSTFQSIKDTIESYLNNNCKDE